MAGFLAKSFLRDVNIGPGCNFDSAVMFGHRQPIGKTANHGRVNHPCRCDCVGLPLKHHRLWLLPVHLSHFKQAGSVPWDGLFPGFARTLTALQAGLFLRRNLFGNVELGCLRAGLGVSILRLNSWAKGRWGYSTNQRAARPLQIAKIKHHTHANRNATCFLLLHLKHAAREFESLRQPI